MELLGANGCVVFVANGIVCGRDVWFHTSLPEQALQQFGIRVLIMVDAHGTGRDPSGAPGGHLLFWVFRFEYEGKFYCKDCLYWCSVCRKYHLGTPRKVFGRRGQEKSVCPDCYRNVADTCRGCLIHEQCLDFGGNRFCPTAYEGLAA